MKPLFLIGYMGCGKSTLGRRLARRLGAEFADTDALIERREGASVADVFRYEGEERFREVEREVLEQTLAGTAAVVSTGGGLPVWRDNMACMNAAGFTVYLRREAEQIARRLSPYGRQKRPRLRGLDDAELVEVMSRCTRTVLRTGATDRRLRRAVRRRGGRNDPSTHDAERITSLRGGCFPRSGRSDKYTETNERCSHRCLRFGAGRTDRLARGAACAPR